MSSGILSYEVEGHVAFITLNRPETGNTLDNEMAWTLRDACERINQDDGVRVVLLQGAGEDFCVGTDEPRDRVKGAGPPACRSASAVASILKPVVAAIQGNALGHGLELALACDIRLAADGARFGLPQVEAGLVPHDGGTQRLPRLVGRGKALELLLTAATIDASEARRIGLVSRVAPRAELAAEARRLVERMAAMAPFSLQFAKEAVNKGMELALEQGLRLEADLYFLMHTTRDRTEGITSFLEKRTPVFEGR
ncbi:MAG: enoyl-CoA hydratase-related protein [Chloroflexota bacterium]